MNCVIGSRCTAFSSAKANVEGNISWLSEIQNLLLQYRQLAERHNPALEMHGCSPSHALHYMHCSMPFDTQTHSCRQWQVLHAKIPAVHSDRCHIHRTCTYAHDTHARTGYAYGAHMVRTYEQGRTCTGGAARKMWQC